MKAIGNLHYLVMALVLLIALSMAVVFSCGDDDDDDDDDKDKDDDDATDDDDTTDDDTTDDDDDTTDDDDDSTHECEELYDVIIEGETQANKEILTWTAKLTISQSGSIIGVVVSDMPEIGQYAISGFRYDQTTGYIKGSFDNPDAGSGDCTDLIISNYMDMLFTDGSAGQTMTGTVTFYCGEIDAANEMDVYTVTGTVTCGDFGV